MPQFSKFVVFRMEAYWRETNIFVAFCRPKVLFRAASSAYRIKSGVPP